MNQLYLLLQIRDADDPMRQHEVDCFQRVLELPEQRLGTFDLLSGPLPESWIKSAAMILIGGSGKYSAAGDGEWLDTALDSLREVHASGTPTFASCWGAQAMARAMGGTVEHLPEQAEVGSFKIQTTEAGRNDELFHLCGDEFIGQLGHEDFVTELPPGTTQLAKTEKAVQAYRFDGLPIFCTQFHPELTKADLPHRFAAYPEYVELATGMPYDELVASLCESPVAAQLLLQFHEQFVKT